MTVVAAQHPEYTYALASYEVDLAGKRITLRKAPVISGTAEVHHRLVASVVLEDAPKPDMIPMPAALPPAPPTAAELAPLTPEQREAQVTLYDNEIAAYQGKRTTYAALKLAYESAMGEQRFSAWLADPRPDHIKANEHYARAVGTPASVAKGA